MIIEHPENLQEFRKEPNEKHYLYFLWFDEVIVYIGETVNLENRLIYHKKDKIFDKVTYKEYTIYDNVKNIEKENVDYYKPIFNNTSECIEIKTENYYYIRHVGLFKKDEIFFKKGKYSYVEDFHFYNGTDYYHINVTNLHSLSPSFYFYKNKQLIKKLNKNTTRNYSAFIKNNELNIQFHDSNQKEIN